ncbi:MAG: hypothetical protein AABZ33_02810 [Chloroflexota bacterium]
MTSWQPFHDSELDDESAGYGAGSDRRNALEMGRELESAAVLDPIQPTPGFVDSVLAAIAQEPAPRAAIAIGTPLRESGIGGIVASVRAAFAMVSLGAGRPIMARAAALAYLVAVGALGLTLGGGAVLGTAGALGLLDSPPPSSPIVLPSPSSSPEPSASPTPAPSPSASPSPSGTVEPSDSPEPSAAGSPGTSARPSASPSGSPSASPSASPSGSPSASPSGSPSGSPDPSETPESSGSPKPSDTPHPSDTPNP